MNQERQIQDIRTFIAYKVDMIIFTPLQESGWDSVLKEAKRAGIPVDVYKRQPLSSIRKSLHSAIETANKTVSLFNRLH